MAKWTGHWAQDQKVWDSILSAGQVQRCRVKLHIPHCLSSLSHNGYLMHRSKVGSIAAWPVRGHVLPLVWEL